MMTFHFRLKRISKPKHNTQVWPRKAERLLCWKSVLETFQAMIGGKFAPLTIMNNKDTDMDLMMTIFNAAVTETAIEILGKHRKKKKTGDTAEILYMCDKRRELRKERF